MSRKARANQSKKLPALPTPISELNHEINTPAVIEEDVNLSLGCYQTYTFQACETDYQALLELINYGIKYAQRDAWQRKFRADKQKPVDSVIPAPQPLQNIAAALLEAQNVPVPDTCPPLPYGHAFSPPPPAYQGAQVSVVNEIKTLRWNTPQLLYSQQIVQRAGAGFKRRTLLFADNFNRPNEFLKAPWKFDNLPRIFDNKLQFHGGDTAYIDLLTERYEVQFDVNDSQSNSLSFYILFCNATNNVRLEIQDDSEYLIIETKAGVQTALADIVAPAYGHYKISYNGAITLEKDGVVIGTYATTVDCGKRIGFECISSTNNQYGITVDNFEVSYYNPSQVPYDLFVEEGVNLRPYIEAKMAELADLSDYDPNGLIEVRCYFDYVWYVGHGFYNPKPPSWQTEGVDQTDINIWQDVQKTQGLQYIARNSFNNGRSRFDYDDGTGSSTYDIDWQQSFMTPVQLRRTGYYDPQFQTKPIILSFTFQSLVPVPQQLQPIVQCRDGIKIYLDQVSYVKKRPWYKSGTSFDITGNDENVFDTTWGGGWQGGVVQQANKGYTAQYQYVLQRFDLHISQCANMVHFKVVVEMGDDPIIDTDGDPDTPPVVVPQLYPMTVFMNDANSNTTIGSWYGAVVGQGEHILEDDFSIPAAPPLWNGRAVTFCVDCRDVQLKLNFPYKIKSAMFTTNDCV